MSAAVLRRIARPRITVAGMGMTRVLDVQSHALKTKHLCQRHNSALSPLDAEAGRLFDAIRTADATIASQEPIVQPLTLIAGIDLERWLAKTLVMTFCARVTPVQKGTHQLPSTAVASIVNPTQQPYGLWIQNRSTGGKVHAMRTQHSAKLSLQANGNQVIGAEVELGGLAFTLRISGNPSDLATSHVYRPGYLNFFHGQRVISIALVWPSPGGSVLWLSREKENAPLPEDTPASLPSAA